MLAQKDRQYLWHPYTQEKTAPLNIPVVKGNGTYLYTETGEKYIDAISSWWVNIHGHAQPYIAKKISEQARTLEQVIFAGFTHPKAVELAERLLGILPSNQKKIFYSDNGSTAVEVALKMAIQHRYNKGGTFPQKNKRKVTILAFEGAYHGDTFGAMSVSARGIFTQPFAPFLFDVVFIPFPSKKNEKQSLNVFKSFIQKNNSGNAVFIFEPLVQGAAGMRTYNAEVLNEMLRLCRKNNVRTIADEVMTGFGRTGRLFASEYLTEKPDIICLSKGITGGFMPLGVTSCSEEIYSAFYTEDKTKTFFHGHSYTANPLACAAACASLDLFNEKQTWDGIRSIEKQHREFALALSKNEKVAEVCTLGTILSIELKTKEGTSYLNNVRDELYSFFLSRKILLRPLGNIIYILPPYCISEKDIQKIYTAVREVLSKS